VQAIVSWGRAPTIVASPQEGGDSGTGDEGGDGDNGQSKSEALVGNMGEDDGNKPVDDVEELAEETADEARDSEDSEEPKEVRAEVDAQEPADEAWDEAADDEDDVEYFITDDRDDSDDEGN